MSPTSVRLVTSWETTADDIAGAAARFREAVLGAAG
jgi:threonine aldolase